MLYLTPLKEELVKHAPIEVWVEAIKQARRSDHKRHRTGCVLWSDYKSPQIYAKGCAHSHNGGLKVRSIHAEMDAISKLYVPDPIYVEAVVVTLTRNNNFAKISKPCSDCARHLTKVCNVVTFCERTNDESWSVLSLDPAQLVNLSPTRYSS